MKSILRFHLSIKKHGVSVMRINNECTTVRNFTNSRQAIVSGLFIGNGLPRANEAQRGCPLSCQPGANLINNHCHSYAPYLALRPNVSILLFNEARVLRPGIGD